MNRNFDIETIDKYVSGQLSGDELSLFEAELSTNSLLAEEVETMQYANQLIQMKAASDLKDQLKNFKPDSGKGKIWFAIAGILLLSIGSILFFNLGKKDNTSLKIIEKTDKDDNQEIKGTDNITENKSSEKSLTNKEKTTGLGHTEINSEKEFIEPEKTDLNESLPVEEENKIVEDKSAQKNINICDNVILTPSILSGATCPGKSEGTIKINGIKGGTGPYLYSIDGGKTFIENSGFNFLTAGSYQLVLKDKNNCISNPLLIEIQEKDCITTQNYILNLSQGETWKIPYVTTGCIVKIVSTSGKVVFSKELQSGEEAEWDGKDPNGQEVTFDVYSYIITCGGKLNQQGYITITK